MPSKDKAVSLKTAVDTNSGIISVEPKAPLKKEDFVELSIMPYCSGGSTTISGKFSVML